MAYQPTLESVKTHPLRNWYDDAKRGIFVTWGVYSVPAFAPPGEMVVAKLLKGEMGFAQSPYAEWYQNSLRLQGSPTHRHHVETYGTGYRYEQFAPQFNELLQAWEPASWAELLARAGARYVVLVTKHHDGFLMWHSRHPNPHLEKWQAARDVAGELSRAVDAQGLKMGFYYSSLLDWSFTQKPSPRSPNSSQGAMPAAYISPTLKNIGSSSSNATIPGSYGAISAIHLATACPRSLRISTTTSPKAWSMIAGCNCPGSSSADWGRPFSDG